MKHSKKIGSMTVIFDDKKRKLLYVIPLGMGTKAFTELRKQYKDELRDWLALLP